ncbi:MAG: hypothetical protein IKB42_03045 [Clostridia bacterium]|nr:hypothetical protein [Clostridia bacterium]MBR4003029.1 hypothetical protein [Clostridia bacterium]
MFKQFISNDLNEPLEILEWINCRLMEANYQYREMQAKKREGVVDSRTVQYFSDKIDFYKDCRTQLTEQVYATYAQDMLVADKNVAKMKSVLWDEFKKRYPECTKKFDEVFVHGIGVYKPFMLDFANNAKKPIPGFNPLNSAFIAYTMVSMEREKIESFKTLFDGIHSEVGDYGAKPFVYRELDKELVGAPIWAINEIQKAIEKSFPQAKKSILKYTMDVQKLKTKLARDPQNKDLAREYNKAYDELDNYTRLVEQYEKLAYSVQSPQSRIKNATNKGAFCGMVNRGYEIMSELWLGVPKNIRKYTVKRDRIICHTQEIDDIVDAGKYCINTAEASMALNAYMGKTTEFELFNYEYSKQLIKHMAKNEAELSMQERDFKRDLSILIDKEEVREAKQDVLDQIRDVKNGYKTTRFNTPFGVVTYRNGKLVNIYTKEEYPVSKVDEYVYDGKGLIFKVDENEAILGIKKYDDMERELAIQQKQAQLTKTTTKSQK